MTDGLLRAASYSPCLFLLYPMEREFVSCWELFFFFSSHMGQQKLHLFIFISKLVGRVACLTCFFFPVLFMEDRFCWTCMFFFSFLLLHIHTWKHLSASKWNCRLWCIWVCARWVCMCALLKWLVGYTARGGGGGCCSDTHTSLNSILLIKHQNSDGLASNLAFLLFVLQSSPLTFSFLDTFFRFLDKFQLNKKLLKKCCPFLPIPIYSLSFPSMYT